jgi:hypothetical protein
MSEQPPVSRNRLQRIVQHMDRSTFSLVRDILGREQLLTGFRHELIGKFLAARYLRRLIAQGPGNSGVDYVTLSGGELWLDIFYFVIDEIDSTRLLNRFLEGILTAGGPLRVRIAAYAIGTKTLQQPDTAVRSAYARAKLSEDLALTPAG